MRPEAHTSPDGLLTLTSEPTLTINAAHPDGFDDWIITLEPGGWHIHPAPTDPEASTDRLIRGILEGRTVLAVIRHGADIVEVRTLSPDESLDEAINREKSNRTPGWSVTFRLWSGRVLATIPESPRDAPP